MDLSVKVKSTVISLNLTGLLSYDHHFMVGDYKVSFIEDKQSGKGEAASHQNKVMLLIILYNTIFQKLLHIYSQLKLSYHNLAY